VPSHTGSGDQGAPGAIEAGVKAILGNTRSIARIRALARWASLYTSVKDDLGRQIEMYGPWVLVDIGDRYDGASPIIPTAAGTGLTDIYAVTFGLDGFHAVSMAGHPLVQTWMPDFSTAGANKSGELEIGPLAVVLKNSKSAAVLRNGEGGLIMKLVRTPGPRHQRNGRQGDVRRRRRQGRRQRHRAGLLPLGRLPDRRLRRGARRRRGERGRPGRRRRLEDLGTQQGDQEADPLGRPGRQRRRRRRGAAAQVGVDRDVAQFAVEHGMHEDDAKR
jgi:hypothetical protein